MTSSTSCARAAAKSAASAQGDRLSPWRSSSRTRSPNSVPPGSRVSTTSRPSDRSPSARRRACVDFPEPSTPSKVTNMRARRICAVRAIVTGGAGFIGSHVVDLLVARGDEVVVLDDLSQGKRENVNAGAELVVLDIRDPGARRRGLRRRTGPRRAFTWRRRPTYASPSKRPDFDCEVNVLGTIRLLEAAREDGTRIVFSSTGGAIYGECDEPATEAAARKPAGAVRDVEARRRGVPRHLQPPVRERAHDPPLRQRLRPAPGPARRGRRRRDLPRASRPRRAATHLRRRGAAARLLYVGDVAAVDLAAARPPGGRVQRRDRARRPRCSISSRPACEASGGAVEPVFDSAAARRAAAKRPRREPGRAASSASRAETSLAGGIAATWEFIITD